MLQQTKTNKNRSWSKNNFFWVNFFGMLERENFSKIWGEAIFFGKSPKRWKILERLRFESLKSNQEEKEKRKKEEDGSKETNWNPKKLKILEFWLQSRRSSIGGRTEPRRRGERPTWSWREGRSWRRCRRVRRGLLEHRTRWRLTRRRRRRRRGRLMTGDAGAWLRPRGLDDGTGEERNLEMATKNSTFAIIVCKELN